MASYRKLSTGWKVTISQRDAQGKLHQVSKNGFATKNEAKLYAAAIEAERNGVISQKKMLFLQIILRIGLHCIKKIN